MKRAVDIESGSDILYLVSDIMYLDDLSGTPVYDAAGRVPRENEYDKLDRKQKGEKFKELERKLVSYLIEKSEITGAEAVAAWPEGISAVGSAEAAWNMNVVYKKGERYYTGSFNLVTEPGRFDKCWFRGEVDVDAPDELVGMFKKKN